jgi:ribosomal protein L7/L12
METEKELSEETPSVVSVRPSSLRALIIAYNAKAICPVDDLIHLAAAVERFQPKALQIMWSNGNKKIPAIKAIRQCTNWGLKDAKDFIEGVNAGKPALIRPDDLLPGLSKEEAIVILNKGEITVEISP